MKNQAYRMALLYDFYGDMLTDRQKEFYDLYYNEDLSLAEIAENYGITRQGVRDVIVRAEAILTELEDKTGIIKRFHRMQQQFLEVEEAVNAIAQRNEQRWQDDEVEIQCSRIRGILDQLKQE
ncbi:YlxM family DNA-binding protein [uncultured Flavonifractor sp.]|uniref:YlxM family DNA-binding protein n=1 Tax=uncultured Flavonifractor sp. TaxID=1193534 RepID=UPI0026019CD9|nr:sigma factor-like helix-turn-helix DNA-binding protein [uncultured Flavonifractor sp.]